MSSSTETERTAVGMCPAANCNTASRVVPGRIRLLLGGVTIVPLVIANTLVEDRYACFEAGMDGFLIKPLDRDKLAEALANLAAGRHIAA